LDDVEVAVVDGTGRLLDKSRLDDAGDLLFGARPVEPRLGSGLVAGWRRLCRRPDSVAVVGAARAALQRCSKLSAFAFPASWVNATLQWLSASV
jgi:hypothetical protein